MENPSCKDYAVRSSPEAVLVADGRNAKKLGPSASRDLGQNRPIPYVM